MSDLLAKMTRKIWAMNCITMPHVVHIVAKFAARSTTIEVKFSGKTLPDMEVTKVKGAAFKLYNAIFCTIINTPKAIVRWTLLARRMKKI